MSGCGGAGAVDGTVPAEPSGAGARILVICTRQIGDVLLTTPLIRAARLRWPQASIDVLGFTGSLGMLSGNPDITELIEIEPGAGWRRAASLVWRLWRRYDLALITQRSDREYLIGWLAAKVRVGPAPGYQPSYAWKRRLLHHAVPDGSEALHIVADKLRLLEPWMAAPPAIDVVPPSAASLPASLAGQLGPRAVVVHVPSMWRYKQWPLDHYRRLIGGLLGDGWQVVLTGGPGAADRRQVAAMLDLAEAPRLVDAAGQLTLDELALLLRQAALYIGPDTSVTHLAAASGVPVIGIFGPTNPVVWGPWPQGHDASSPYQRRGQTQRVGRVILLQGPNECVPCTMEGCERHRDSRSDCLVGITPERVLALARERLRDA